MIPDRIVLTRSQIHLILTTLAVAPFCTNIVSIRATLKRFFDLHPDEQLFVFSVKKEAQREP